MLQLHRTEQEFLKEDGNQTALRSKKEMYGGGLRQEATIAILGETISEAAANQTSGRGRVRASDIQHQQKRYSRSRQSSSLTLPVDEVSPIETATRDRRWSKEKMVYYLRTAFRNDEDARVAGPLPAVNDGDFKKIRLNVSNNGGDNDVCLKDYLEQYWSYKNYTGEQIEQELAALTLEPYVNMK
mmetsp:Transcript_11700/g.19223  ORF Transcript_11700/g.19223 Transcript_11700/m.19223 type:complete len:185 (-) Transcript_11700:1740-2294(-)